MKLKDKQKAYVNTMQGLKILYQNINDPKYKQVLSSAGILLNEYSKFIFNKNLEKGRKSQIDIETKKQIKELYKNYNFTISELGRKFGISRNTIRKIVNPTVDDIKKMVEEKEQEQLQRYYLEKNFEEIEPNYKPNVSARDVADIPEKDQATEKQKEVIEKLERMNII